MIQINGEKNMREIVVVSGGFDPIHSGHIKLIKEASKHGEVVVLLNSDLWLQKKKGKEFLSFKERNIIMNELKNVIDVIEFDDGDTTCIEGLKKVKNKYSDSIIKFANGGDRNDNTTPESIFCNENNIELLWGVGGNDKSNSSSWILKKWKQDN